MSGRSYFPAHDLSPNALQILSFTHWGIHKEERQISIENFLPLSSCGVGHSELLSYSQQQKLTSPQQSHWLLVPIYSHRMIRIVTAVPGSHFTIRYPLLPGLMKCNTQSLELLMKKKRKFLGGFRGMPSPPLPLPTEKFES